MARIQHPWPFHMSRLNLKASTPRVFMRGELLFFSPWSLALKDVAKRADVQVTLVQVAGLSVVCCYKAWTSISGWHTVHNLVASPLTWKSNSQAKFSSYAQALKLVVIYASPGILNTVRTDTACLWFQELKGNVKNWASCEAEGACRE